MNELYKTILLRFFIGGTILSASTILANMSNPLLAGIIVTVPLELISLFFVKGKQREDYALCILIMSIATVFPVLYYFVIMGKTGLSHDIFFNSHSGSLRSLRLNDNQMLNFEAVNSKSVNHF